jgi:hypothetical protein
LLLLEIGLPLLGFTPLSFLLGVLAGLGQFAILLLLFEIGLPLLGFTPLSFLLGLSSLGRRLVLEGKIDQPQRKEREDSNAHNQQRDNRHRYFSRHSFHSDVWGMPSANQVSAQHMHQDRGQYQKARCMVMKVARPTH